MNRRAVGGWIVGGMTVAGVAISTLSWLGWSPPAFIWPDMEIHLYGWMLLTGAGLGGTIGLSWSFIDRKCFLPRREAVERFRSLREHAETLHQNFVDGYQATPQRREELRTPGVVASQNLEVRLRGLGMAYPSSIELLDLIDMMERGALREARRRWPLPREGRHVARDATATPNPHH